MEVMMEDVTESALDMVNSVQPAVAIALILVVWLRVVMVVKEEGGDDEMLG